MDTEEATTPYPPCLPLSGDLLERKSKFGFIWFVAHGGLDTKVKRGQNKRAIMEFRARDMWKELDKYIPHHDCTDPMAMYTVTRVTTLGKGIAMLMNYQIDYIIQDSLKVVAMSKERRSNPPSVIEPMDEPDPLSVLEEGEEEAGEQENQDEELPAPRRRRGARQGAAAPVARHPTPSEEDEEGSPVAPPPPKQKRKRRRVEVPSETEVLRILTEKQATLNPRANLIPDSDLPVVPPLNNKFSEEGDLVDDHQDEFSFHLNCTATGGQDEPAIGPTDEDRASSRIHSERSPEPNIQPRQAGRRRHAPEQNSLELAPVAAVDLAATPRARRSRRLIFLDTSTFMSIGELKQQILDNQRSVNSQTMPDLVKLTHFWPPSTIRRGGMAFIQLSERCTGGIRMNQMMGDIKARMPISDELREREIARVEQSFFVTQPESHLDEPSGGEPSAAPDPTQERSGLEGTRSWTGLGPEDLSGNDNNPAARPVADIADEAGIDITVLESPRGPQAAAEQRLPTFSEIAGPGSKRAYAIGVFMALLNNQKKGNVELIQDEFCGEIKIRTLKQFPLPRPVSE